MQMHLFVALLYLCIPSYSMKLEVDDTLSNNATMRYWERVQVADPGDNSSTIPSEATVSINLQFSKVSNVSTTGYLVIYNALLDGDNLDKGTFECCTEYWQKKLGPDKQCVLGSMIEGDASFIKQLDLVENSQIFSLPDHLVDDTGTYVVLVSICDTSIDIRVNGTLAWKSSHGFIFPEEYPLIEISLVLAGFYFVVFLFFGGLCFIYRGNLYYIHYGIVGALLLSVLNQTLWYYYYHIMNVTGNWTLLFLGFIVLVQITTQISRLVLLLMLSLGLGTSVSLLKTARVVDYDVLRGFGEEDDTVDTTGASINSPAVSSDGCCLKSQPGPPTCNNILIFRLVVFCILTFSFQYVDAMISTTRVYSPSYLLTKSNAVVITSIVVLLILVFYLWMVVNIINTFRFLKGHPAQLRDYKFLLVALVIAFLLGIGAFVYKVYSKLLEGNLDANVDDWASVWENRLLWSLVSAFLLFSIAAIWNPYRTSSSAYSRATHVA